MFAPCSIDQLASLGANGCSTVDVEDSDSTTVTQLPLDLLPRHHCAVELTVFGR